ncbi:hypothetical protein IC615_00010 [Serratia ureilytica]
MSPEQIQQVDDLKSELVSTDAEIENAAKQQDTLNGSLIKSLSDGATGNSESEQESAYSATNQCDRVWIKG